MLKIVEEKQIVGKRRHILKQFREDYEIVCNHEDFRWSERWGKDSQRKRHQAEP